MILILRLALARAGAEVSCAGMSRVCKPDDPAQRAAQAVDDERGREVAALGQRLQADEHAPRFCVGLGPPAPIEEPTPATAGSARTISRACVLELPHGLERDVGAGFRGCHDEAGIVLRQVAFRQDAVEMHGHDDGGDEDGGA